ncbi:hypothetical protein E3N88_06213 [Mikania micrantha]|uniref:Reverse transcriptase zinc-binding domain-containing protein n=1 Tax=Mikania micrantha TaxID=192012 RepID=A0A5N6PQ82_9ASTR|nr:hypothetical protein E3N88_06213 [Mikania micrantha]
MLKHIQTKDALQSRGVRIDSTCMVCSSQEETANHALLGCSFADEVWDRVMSWCKCPRGKPNSIDEHIELIERWPGNSRYKRSRLGHMFATGPQGLGLSPVEPDDVIQVGESSPRHRKWVLAEWVSLRSNRLTPGNWLHGQEKRLPANE